MRNPGTDFHRRDADARKGAELWRGWLRKQANAAEWLRRSREAHKAGDLALSERLFQQAGLELQGQH